MKRCPECRRDYADEEMFFCLDDGARLLEDPSSHDAPTIAFGTPLPGEYGIGDASTQLFGDGSVQQPGPRSGDVRNSIAVLPFAHLSKDDDDEYFCDGLAEELINALSKLDKLKVVARTSAFSFKGKNVDVSQIGKALNVETIIEGSVRKSGDSLRITVQMINAADGFHIWSHRFDREMRDVFELQDEIALAVVDELRSKLLSEEKAEMLQRFTANTEAYHQYLQGRFYLNKFITEQTFRAVECFTDAIAVAPDFARAYAGLADALIMLTEMGPMPPEEAMPKAKEAALKAIELDPDLAEAHASLGTVLQDYDYDFAGAEREFLRAIELGPNNPLPHQAYGILLTELERHDEAEAQFQKMLEFDPLSVVGNWVYSFCLFLARRFDEALDRAQKTLELDPSFGMAHLSAAFAYQMLGKYDESVAAYAQCSEVMGFPQNADFIRGKYKGGWDAFMRSMTSRERPMSFSSYIGAVFFATLGDKDGAFAELETSLAKRESHIVMMKADPRFDSLRDDPRFKELLIAVGFPD